MIYALHIKNYLLIEQIEMDFQSGLTVITGETGAGKSLIIDSIGLALGTRAAPGVVRHGCDKAEIYVRFSAERPSVRNWLLEHELYEDSEAIIRRVIFPDRPSRAYINGNPVTLNRVKELAPLLISIHGQSEHQTLQSAATQRKILDGFANIEPLTQQLAELAAEIRSAEAERTSRADELLALNKHLVLLEHQHTTLMDLQPMKGEFTELKQELLRKSHAVDTATTLGEVSQQLFYGDELTLSQALAENIQRIEKLVQIDESLAQHAQMLYEAQVRLDDVAREINAIAERTDYDPARIDAIEQRMAVLQKQARIHDVNADDLSDLICILEQQIEELNSKLAALAGVDERIETTKSKYRTIAAEVTKTRKKATDQLAEAVTWKMQSLGMQGGTFSIRLLPEEPETFSSIGNENVRFFVATAPGQEPGPLASVASGGELSRLSLSIQVVAANTTEVPSIVFDEIDVGIGGKVATRVGELLQTLGQTVQIFCITHLPQVAAKGNQQLNVTKVHDATSSVQIQNLDDQQRVMEIARMLSGAKITDRTTEHARELLTQKSI